MGVRIVGGKSFGGSYNQQPLVSRHKNGERSDHVGRHVRRSKLYGVQSMQRMFGHQLLCPPRHILTQCDNPVLTPNMKQKVEPKTVEICSVSETRCCRRIHLRRFLTEID